VSNDRRNEGVANVVRHAKSSCKQYPLATRAVCATLTTTKRGLGASTLISQRRIITTNRNCIQGIQYCLMNNLTQAVDARPDITMHRLSRGMTVKELPTISIGIIAIVAVPATHKIGTLVGHIIRSSCAVDPTSNARNFPRK